MKYFSNKFQDPSSDIFGSDFTDLEYNIFTSLQYLKLFLVDLLFFILSIVIDSVLVLFIKQSITRTSHNNELKKKCKQRIVLMIVLNGVNFLLLRLPSFLLDFYVLIFNYNYNTRNGIAQYKPDMASYLVCRFIGFCESLDQIYDFLVLFSFLNQFFIFYKLDSYFREAFKSVLNKRNERETAANHN